MNEKEIIVQEILKEMGVDSQYAIVNFGRMTSLDMSFVFCISPKFPFEFEIQNLNSVITYDYEFRINLENYRTPETSIAQMVMRDLAKIRDHLSISFNNSVVACYVRPSEEGGRLKEFRLDS